MNSTWIPYGRQIVDDADVDAVVEVLRSDWLTTGPAVETFEQKFSAFVGAGHGIAVTSGTAALHLCMLAAEIGPGDEVIVPTMTFAASANCARYVGADVVFVDVDDATLSIDVDHAASLVTQRTRAIVAVDYAGMPCDLDELRTLADQYGLLLVEDASHAPGATYHDQPVGSIADLTVFSFHPVKQLTTGEGGMVTTDDDDLAGRLRRLRNHGIDTDARQRQLAGSWEYDLVELGFNYRLSDINCALGASQLVKLPTWIERRTAIARRYSALLDLLPARVLEEPDDRTSAWHLYPVRLTGDDVAERRRSAFAHLRTHGVGVNVHYRPVHLHSYYRSLGYRQGLCPVAEAAYDGLLSLPMWPGLSDEEQDRVVELLAEASS